MTDSRGRSCALEAQEASCARGAPDANTPWSVPCRRMAAASRSISGAIELENIMFGCKTLYNTLVASMLLLGLALVPARAEAQWSTPVQPPAGCGTTPTAPAPSLALNASGAWVVVGYAQTGSGLQAFSVMACTSSDGVTWSAPVTIGLGTSPSVAMAPDGRAVAVWQGGPSTSPNIQAAIRRAGGNWSAPVVISTLPGRPLIGMDGAGNAIAVWGGGSTLSTPVATASLSAGSTSWSSTTILAAHGGGIDLATSFVGGALVGWKTPSPGLVQAATGTTLGGFGAPVAVGPTARTPFPPLQVVIDSLGAASFAYQAGGRDNVITRALDGTWSAVTNLAAGISGYGAGIDTAIDGAGNAIAGFDVTQSTGTLTYVSLHPAGGAWGTATLMSALNDKGGVAAAGDEPGTFVVTWINNAGQVVAVTAPPGGGFGPATAVGAAPLRRLLVIPGKAVLWSASGISTQIVN
jgi:hypothetical protein